jgi:hypothetical protein
MKVRILSAAATIFTIIAALVASSACAWDFISRRTLFPEII